MKVYISVGDAVAVALLDSGSSHNFVDVDMAQRASIRLKPNANLSVVVANGERISSSGNVVAQTVHIGREAFDLDKYALPLGEYDMVLDLQWLGKRILCHGVDTTPGLGGSHRLRRRAHGHATRGIRELVRRSLGPTSPPQVQPPHSPQTRHGCRGGPPISLLIRKPVER